MSIRAVGGGADGGISTVGEGITLTRLQ